MSLTPGVETIEIVDQLQNPVGFKYNSTDWARRAIAWLENTNLYKEQQMHEFSTWYFVNLFSLAKIVNLGIFIVTFLATVQEGFIIIGRGFAQAVNGIKNLAEQTPSGHVDQAKKVAEIYNEPNNSCSGHFRNGLSYLILGVMHIAAFFLTPQIGGLIPKYQERMGITQPRANQSFVYKGVDDNRHTLKLYDIRQFHREQIVTTYRFSTGVIKNDLQIFTKPSTFKFTYSQFSKLTAQATKVEIENDVATVTFNDVAFGIFGEARKTGHTFKKQFKIA